MSVFDSFKMFRDKSVDVTCPECSRIAQLHKYKLRKEMTMICPYCGSLFSAWGRLVMIYIFMSNSRELFVAK